MEKKLNYSEKRNAILAVLKSTDTHPSAEWIYEKVKEKQPGIGIATVYRNLKVLLERKEIFKVDVGDGIDHYDAQISLRHDHTYCMCCGAISDAEAALAVSPEKLTTDDFSVDSYSMVLYGKCKNCKNEETQNYI